jgi:hypothetical protein
MKVRVRVNVANVNVDETVEGASEEELVAKVRREVEARAPFLARVAIRAMDDRALWRRVVEAHNSRTGAGEPAPDTAREFLEFGERAGYVTWLER